MRRLHLISSAALLIGSIYLLSIERLACLQQDDLQDGGHRVADRTSDANSEGANKTEKLDLVTLLTTQNFTFDNNQGLNSMNRAGSLHSLQEVDGCNRVGENSDRGCQKQHKERHNKKQFKRVNGGQNDIWLDSDMLQHPIDEEPRKMDRSLGEMCLYSGDCVSGCCMLDRETKIRSCQPKAIKGERCTNAQVKGDLYVDLCPCESGDLNCVFPGEYCAS